MQLNDLVKPLDQMTDEELLEHLRKVRHNREIVRPAARRYVEKAEKKESRGKVTKAEAMLDKLSAAEKEALIKMLGGA